MSDPTPWTTRISKRDLEKQVKDLARRVRELESRQPLYPVYPYPLPQPLSPYQPYDPWTNVWYTNTTGHLQ